MLRATSPLDAPVAPHDRGPLMEDTSDPTDPIPVRPLSDDDVTILHQVIDDILQAAIDAPSADKLCINRSFSDAETFEYGTVADQKIVIVSDPRDQNPKMQTLSTQYPCTDRRVNNLVIENGAEVSGAGLLILPREMWIKDGTFDWKGLILVLENGKIKIEAGTCGAVYGGVLLQTNPTRNNARLDFDKNLENGACNRPNNAFSINFACDVLQQTIGDLLSSVAWLEVFDER
jgi:hypothetical protein